MTSSATHWCDPVPYTELSERQQEIMRFLWDCASSYSPSIREIGETVGLSDTKRYQLDQLEARGGYDDIRGTRGHWSGEDLAGNLPSAPSCHALTTSARPWLRGRTRTQRP
jgi:hypothetical protein